MAAFHLSRATPEDMPELMEIIGRAGYNQDFEDFCSGPNTPEQRKISVAMFQTLVKQTPQFYFLKLTDVSTGTIIAGSMWRIDLSDVPGIEDWPRPWLADRPERREYVDQTMKDIIATLKRLHAHPHIHLTSMFTDPAYRRRGAASLMVQWGCDLADQMFLPVWLEASALGEHVYKRFGFVEVDRKPVFGAFMYREVKPSQFKGGKSPISAT